MLSRLALTAAVGLLAGALTLWSVPHLPFSLEPLGNSAAPWILVAFALALTARATTESLLLAFVALVALVVGFYVAEALRGWPVSRHQVMFWAIASGVAGPLLGLAADRIRRADRTAGALGAGVVGGILTGEAVYGLTELQFSSPAAYWDVQFVLGIALAVTLTLWRSRHHPLGSAPALAASLAACAGVAVVTLAAYRVL